MLPYLVCFYGQMLVQLCLSVLLSLTSHIVFICTIIFELINIFISSKRQPHVIINTGKSTY